MSSETYKPEITQLPLLNLDESTNAVELFPAVWAALENLIGSNLHERHQSLLSLQDINAARFSPLVAYILITLLSDSDLELRKIIIHVLGEVLAPDEDGNPAPTEVRTILLRYLGQLRTRQIYAILQALTEDYTLVTSAKRIFNACSFAGTHLIEILNDPMVPLEIRKYAALMIGEVGYSGALSALERIENRLESKIIGQKSMPFLPTTSSGEEELLPVLQQVITLLKTP